MRCRREIRRFASRLLMLVGIAVASAATAGEPLIVTKLREPDPGLTAIPEPRLDLTKLGPADDPALNADQAVESFSRTIGDALMAQQQATQARCRSAQPAVTSAADRFAWAANCRYIRH